ncbi:MAG: class I SAM-dependent RNA methyltransferase [Treponema sp.]|jgi:23S rRNA (uracil1939-C5)-methyltransferase|nr:class I SAM-dependent RNA methyltransferase [Treponema sp.]
MVTGELFTAPVAHIAPGGAGILRVKGQTIFMEFTAPGDLVTGRITEEHRDWGRAELVELKEPSPLRTSPACPLYGTCGGCSLQHLSYGAQIHEKEIILRDLFTRIGRFTALPPILVRPSLPLEYRNRLQFHRVPPPAPGQRRRGNRPREERFPLGFKARKSSEIIPVPDCPVATPELRLALRERAITAPPEKDRFTVYARGETLLSEGARRRGKVRILDRELTLDAGVFFQSNGTVLETLIRDIRGIAARAEGDLPMADIYCGVGTFGAFLGEGFSGIDLVEENKTALALARENVPEKGAAYYAQTGDVWVKARTSSGGTGRGKVPYGFIVVDPPREGLSAGMRDWLSREGVPLLAYLSCDPATLARDSRDLTERGAYDLAELILYDFYPQTAHIETLAVFKNVKP